jgi:NAD(P)-dependent dehydrogenase (short-subunit alcohol dehydrogenase family)
MKHEVAAMLKTGGGAIVNTSSALGHVGAPELSVYVASKHAVEGLTKVAALEFAKKDITGTGKTVAEQNAIDRRAAQQGSPTEPAPTTVHQPDPTDVVDYYSPQDEADILWIMKTRHMDRQTATIIYNSQPDTWHRLHQLTH